VDFGHLSGAEVKALVVENFSPDSGRQAVLDLHGWHA
jgi:hypothetical protein